MGLSRPADKEEQPLERQLDLDFNVPFDTVDYMPLDAPLIECINQVVTMSSKTRKIRGSCR